MYCPSCGSSNGDFNVRCHHCGELLPPIGPQRTAGQPSRSRLILAVLSATAGLTTTLLVVLAALVTRANLWPALVGNVTSSTGGSVGPTPTAALEVATVLPANLPRPLQPRDLRLGEVAVSGAWRIAVDAASFHPDDSSSGWLQAVITYTVQNASNEVANLPIPATTANPPPAPLLTPGPATILPLPAVAAQSPALVTGLRLFLLDRAKRQFGGGFDTSGGGFDDMAAPGDAMRLTYRFRYPQDSVGPYVLRLMFPTASGGRTFDVHLDQRSRAPATLVPNATTERVPVGQAVVVGQLWSITCEGVNFSPVQTQGERPVTVRLLVKNLGNTPRAALTDPADANGTQRDFYLTDSSGRLAYSHADDLPGVQVPAHAAQRVMVHLYTEDLPSAAHPLYFTTVVDWRTNRYAQFEIP
jgi:hypothetical protein